MTGAIRHHADALEHTTGGRAGPQDDGMALTTRRQTLGHLLVCVGCCCGQVAKGKPEVPADWLKAEWKRRTLLKHIQLSISGCLGPCDLVNVVAIAGPAGTTYVGGLTTRRHFELLLDWATQSTAGGRLLPLPPELAPGVIDRFRAPVTDEPAVAV